MRDSRFRSSVPHLVGKLFRQVARVHGRAMRPFEVSAVHANILSALWLDGPMTIGQLQSELSLGSSTLTGAIDRMTKAGLVRRVANPGDRRSWRIEPVEWPAKKRDAMLDALEDTERACLADLTATERRELARLLAKAIASVAKVDDGDEDP